MVEAVVEFRGAERYGSAACLDLGLSVKSQASSLTRGPSRHLRLAQGLVHLDEGPVPYKLPRGEGPPRLGS